MTVRKRHMPRRLTSCHVCRRRFAMNAPDAYLWETVTRNGRPLYVLCPEHLGYGGPRPSETMTEADGRWWDAGAPLWAEALKLEAKR